MNTRTPALGNALHLQVSQPSAAALPRLAAANGSAGDCRVVDLLRLMGDQGDAFHSAGTHAAANHLPLAMRRLHAGEALFRESAPAEAIYFVRAGTFKMFRTAEDGYEQVLGFVGRAEVIGFDAVCLDTHPTSAVALEESSVYLLLMPDVFSLGQRLPALDRVLHLAASHALARRVELADVMAAVAAEARLARFLLQLSKSMAACGHSPRRFHLRMSRRDIASHLGVAHETVSRSFSALARWGLVAVENREVEVLDMAGLKTLSRNTRRQVEEPRGAGGPALTLVPPTAADTLL